MAFSVDQFQDLLRLLEAHPEWRAELRRHVLSDELLELPALVRQQAEHLASIAARMDQLTERMDQLTERMDQLTERMDQLTARMDQLAERMDQLAERMGQLAVQMGVQTERIDRLTERVDGLAIDVGHLKGGAFEQHFRERAPAYFGHLVRRPRLIEHAALADLLDDAVEEGRLAQAERDALLLADLVVRGRDPADGAELYLVVEASVSLGMRDVERAATRATLLKKLGRPVLPVVVGESAPPDVVTFAAKQGVAHVPARPHTWAGG